MNKKRLIPILTTYTLILGVIFPSTPVNAAMIKNIVSDPASPVHSESVTGNISENSTPSDIMRSSAQEFSEDLLAPESEDDLFEEAIDNFSYVDANGNAVGISGSAVKLTDETDVSIASRQYYYVEGNVEINHGLIFGGTNIYLILRNKSNLRITNTSGSGITANNLYIFVEEGSTAENQGKIIINSSDNCIKSTSSKIYGGGIDCTCTGNNIPAILCSNTFETYRSPVISIRTNGVGIESDSTMNRTILSGGKISITGSTNAYAIWGKHSIDISGDDTELTITSSGRGISANQTVNINGGTINITNTQAQGIYANYNININGGKTNISSTGNALEAETITVNGGQTTALSSGGTGFSCRSSLKFLFRPFDSYVIASSYNKSVNTMNNTWNMQFLCVEDGSIISNGSDMSGYGGKRIVRYCGDSGYNVLVDDNISHGTVTANTYGSENLQTNTRVTLTLTPDNGYTIASVTLTKPDQTTVELTGNNGTYVFTPVAGLNRISVSFVELTPVYYVDETDTRCTVYPEKLTASSAGVNLTRSAYYVDGELNITENSIHFTNDAILILKKNSRLTINNTIHETAYLGAKEGIIADGNLKIYVEEGSTSANQGTIEVLSADRRGIKVSGNTFLINGGNIIADAPYSNMEAYAIYSTSINIRNANVKLNTRSSAMDKGLHSQNSINIENSTLEIKAGAAGANDSSGSTGIYASNNLTVTGAQSSISVTSGAWGILCNNGNAVFENGTLTVSSVNEAIKAKNITINGNSKITASSTAANKNAIYISDNTGRLTFGFTSPGFIQASSYGHSAVASDAAFGTANLITGSRNYFSSTGLIVVNGSNLKSLAGEKIQEGFTINLSDVENGTLAVNKTSGNPGDEIIVTPTPNTGYVVSRVTYTNSSDSSGPQEIIADANGQYRFIINASAPYTVSATFTEKTENVSYINEQGTTTLADNAILLSRGGSLSGTAYYVEGNVTLSEKVIFSSNTGTILILKNGSNLTINTSNTNCIEFSKSLKIFREAGTGTVGTITLNEQGTDSQQNYCIYSSAQGAVLGFYKVKAHMESPGPNNMCVRLTALDSNLYIHNNSEFVISDSSTYGIFCSGNTSIKNSTVNITSGSVGSAISSKNITIDGTATSITISSENNGLTASNEITINDGIVNITSGFQSINGESITINGGKITASGMIGISVPGDGNVNLSFNFSGDSFVQVSSYVSNSTHYTWDTTFNTNGKVYVVSTTGEAVTGANIRNMGNLKIVPGFTVTLASTTNGNLTSNKTSGILGTDSVELTPTPVLGYKVGTVTYTDSTGPHTISLSNGKYTFTPSVSTNYTVSATFTEITENVSYKDEQGTTRVANNAVFLSKGGSLSGAAYYVEGNITLTQGINFTNTSPTILILKKGSHLTINNATGNGISTSGNLKIFITSDSSSSDWGSLTINSTGGKGINNTAGTFTLAGGNINITASDDAVNSNGFTMSGGCLTANGGNGFSGIKLSNTATFSIDLPAGSFLKASSYSDGNASSTPFNSANFNPNGKAYVCIESGEAFTAATMKSITNKTVKAGYNVIVDGSIVKGSLTSDKSGGISGETVTLTPTPDTYYEINRVTYTDSNGTHNVNKNAAGKYTFSASSGMNTVSAIFTPTNYTITYNDVDGATFTGGNNPSTYNVESPAIRIKNPDKDMAIFKGWEGTDINGKSMNLIIPAGSHGNRTFTATWKIINEGTVDNGDDNKNGYSTEKAESFIHNLYRGILDREADESGLNYWTNQLKDKKISLYQLVKGFTDSTEFTGRGLSDADFIRALYKGVLSRDPAQSEVDSWLDQMNNNGYTRDDVIAGFLNSKELMNLQSEISESLGNGKTLPIVYFNQGIYDFVIRNYVCILDREGEPGGVEYWGRILLAGEKTPEEVTMGFLHSPEFRAKRISSEDYVKILYRTFLGREADEEGLKYWVNKLKNGSSRESIVPGFSNSEEFKALLKSYGL